MKNVYIKNRTRPKKGTKQSVKLVAVCLISLFFAVAAALSKDMSRELYNSLVICAATLVPALFPFMVISEFIVNTGAFGVLSHITAPLGRLLFRDENAAAIMLLSLIGGYPVGPKICEKLYQSGKTEIGKAVNAACFCVNPSAPFAITAVGIGLYGSLKTGIVFFISNALACLFTGVIFTHIGSRSNKSSDFRIKKTSQKQSGGQTEVLRFERSPISKNPSRNAYPDRFSNAEPSPVGIPVKPIANLNSKAGAASLHSSAFAASSRFNPRQTKPIKNEKTPDGDAPYFFETSGSKTYQKSKIAPTLPNEELKKRPDSVPLYISFINAVSSSSSATVTMCAFAAFVSGVFSLAGYLPINDRISGIIHGIFEISAGIFETAKNGVSPAITAALISFGGICVHLQCLYASKELKPSLIKFIAARATHALLGGLFCFALCSIFNIPDQSAAVAAAYATFAVSPSMSARPVAGIASLCSMILFLCDLQHRQNRFLIGAKTHEI